MRLFAGAPELAESEGDSDDQGAKGQAVADQDGDDVDVKREKRRAKKRQANAKKLMKKKIERGEDPNASPAAPAVKKSSGKKKKEKSKDHQGTQGMDDAAAPAAPVVKSFYDPFAKKRIVVAAPVGSGGATQAAVDKDKPTGSAVKKTKDDLSSDDSWPSSDSSDDEVPVKKRKPSGAPPALARSHGRDKHLSMPPKPRFSPDAMNSLKAVSLSAVDARHFALASNCESLQPTPLPLLST